MNATFKGRLKMALANDEREQKDIAEALGVTSSQVSAWKRGVSPKPDLIGRIIYELGIDGHWLMTGEGSMQSSGEREELGLRLEVIGHISDGRVEKGELKNLRVAGGALDQGQADQLELQETLERAKNATASLSDIERRLAAIERFELTPMSELTEEEVEAAKKLAAKGKTARYGEEEQALGEGTKGG